MKVGDLLSLGLILMSIFIFFTSLHEQSLFIKLFGLSGAVITIIVEITFLWKVWRK